MTTKYKIPKEDLQRYNNGSERQCWRYLGAHPMDLDGTSGVGFAVWAPGVKSVRVIGEFTDWQPGEYWLEPLWSSGVWSGFVPGVEKGMLYKFLIETAAGDLLYKADPCAFSAEARPGTASRVTDLAGFRWTDKTWMTKRAKADHFKKPLNIYEVHLGSWRQHDVPREREEDIPLSAFYTYREMADELVPYVKEMGYTHVELMPVMEHPLDGSWGYQVTGFFAATSRYGSPQDLMYLVNAFHEAGIGVILDWVPGHFCRDEFGLGRFNGEKLYEDMDHPQWGTYTFDFGRKEVRSFLLSNAVYWLEVYHADGIRVDGVSSILYLNYGMDDSPNKRYNMFGGEGNLEAISFLQEFNQAVGERFPGVITIAEESTAWPNITKPPYESGLGFHYKWDMGWMNDTLAYFQTDFPWRPGVLSKLTFSMMYAFSENFVLPLSHDEVVHGKASLINKQPGGDDLWRRFAGLRLLALYQMTHSGAKLNFMGSEIGQFREWQEYHGVEWFLLDYEHHRKHQEYIKALNHIYLEQPSLWQKNYSWDGFQWIDADNKDQSVLIFSRQGDKPQETTVVVINLLPQGYEDFRLGVPGPGIYKEVFNSDETRFGGNGIVNLGDLRAKKTKSHGKDYSVSIRVPPLGGVILKFDGQRRRRKSALAALDAATPDTDAGAGTAAEPERAPAAREPAGRGSPRKAVASEKKKQA